MYTLSLSSISTGTALNFFVRGSWILTRLKTLLWKFQIDMQIDAKCCTCEKSRVPNTPHKSHKAPGLRRKNTRFMRVTLWLIWQRLWNRSQTFVIARAKKYRTWTNKVHRYSFYFSLQKNVYYRGESQAAIRA